MHAYITEWSILGFPGIQKNLGCSGLGSIESLLAFIIIIILLAPTLFQVVFNNA